jgi:predicted RNA binding protein YcfA (HicA-like mRNA interferase family)
MLVADGWCEVAQKGSQVQLKHPFRKGRVTCHIREKICRQVL